MFLKMWEFVGYLGMIILMLILFAIIFELLNVIYSNIKINILKRKMIREISKKAANGDFKISLEKEEE